MRENAQELDSIPHLHHTHSRTPNRCAPPWKCWGSLTMLANHPTPNITTFRCSHAYHTPHKPPTDISKHHNLGDDSSMSALMTTLANHPVARCYGVAKCYRVSKSSKVSPIPPGSSCSPSFSFSSSLLSPSVSSLPMYA